jgi:hypothetical protein
MEPKYRCDISTLRYFMAVWRSHRNFNNIHELALHIAFWENGIAKHRLYHITQMNMLKILAKYQGV